MNGLGIHSIIRKKRHEKRWNTLHIAPNVLNRNFTADRPNQKWVTDVTEFRAGQEKLYLSAPMDLVNREIIAYRFAAHLRFSMVKQMPEQGLSRLMPTDYPIIHSNRGLYNTKLAGDADGQSRTKHEVVRELLYAVIESLFGILRSECFYPRRYTSIADLQAELEAYLVYYNQERVKMDLKELSPAGYRARYLV